MKTAQDIILRPIVTEESMKNMQQKKYTFRVAMDATKIEIAQAAEALFGVEVAKVNTMHMNGKGDGWVQTSVISRTGKRPSSP